ncbi:non-ribosomal peptide synthetase [Actinoallomurus iriomotensis]|uniref:Carrier domain-containing protein n=1 Tax=Actinoallomurus iriomotensis TaxID=478107 RepID=A0A9W6RWU5_9ACTN|nr:non-ribosomal peptide synthetase [Actinoallomurus iriomotensis]GLY81597.1 hypothetical protein Airi01_098640 [Actinoallomurus iriomotensis]
MNGGRVARASVLGLFEHQANRRPDEVAVVCGSQSATFGELNTAANALARRLVRHGAGAEQVVGCVLNRSIASVQALLAVLKAGAVHLAIDPRDPRIALMLGDANPAIVLTDERSAPHLAPSVDRIIVNGPTADEDTRNLTDAERGGPILPHHAAYVVYTSGSSGAPKGVVVEQRNLTNLYAEHERSLFPVAVEAAERERLNVAHSFAFSFDASWNPLMWMLAGHRLVLADGSTHRDPRALVDLVTEHDIDVMEAVPSILEPMITAGLLETARPPAMVLLGGEAVGQGLWNRLREAPRTIAVNLYGPSECTVFATSARVADHRQPVIGTPITGADVVVAGPDGRPVPDGQAGQLLISGACVARGYLNRPELTAERFVGDPAAYQTGDRVRMRPDGALEFLGRVDQQVKVRGHRIELGEVERALLAHPAVSQAAVVLVTRGGGRQCLAAYLVAQGEPTATDLRAFLGGRLPGFMIPAVYVLLAALPSTAHGKVDRAALPAPEFARPALTTPYVPPGDGLQQTIAMLWSELLNVDDIGADDDFVDLGGDSLLAAESAARLTAMGVRCELEDLLDFPTVASLADHLGPDGPAVRRSS